MAIATSSFYHGIALYQLLRTNKEFLIQSFPTASDNSYSINNDIGIHIRYSAKTRSPWIFNFTRQNQEELRIMQEMHKFTFIVFVCGKDGITCMEYMELKKILDEYYEELEWVKLARLSGESYTVTGKDGKLDHKLRASDFPKKIIDAIDEISIT